MASRGERNVDDDEFYLRYYVGHKGRYGHEFLEFEFRSDGKLRYVNNSHYKEDVIIRKEVYVSDAVLKAVQRNVQQTEILKEDDNLWPAPNINGRQELEIVMGNQHIAFVTAKIGALVEIQEAQDKDGLQNFYFLVQDLKVLVFALIGMHFKIKPY